MSSKAGQKGPKKTVTAESARLHRHDSSVALRKEKREEGLQKRRNMAAEAGQEVAAIAMPTADVTLAQLPAYCAAARSSALAEQLAGVTAIRRLISKENQPPVLPVINAGIVPRLIEFVTSTDAKLAFEAAWAVTNIASTEHTGAIIAAVPSLVQGMMSADGALREQCIWCIGNIAGDSPKFRDVVFGAAGAVQALLLNAQHPETPGLLANVAWTLSNLCRGKPAPAVASVAPLVPALVYLVGLSEPAVLADALWGLSYLTEGNDATIQAVVDTGVAPRCVALLGHPDAQIVTAAMRIVGNLISGDEGQTQAAIDAGALRGLVPLLMHPKRTLRREACWTVSNVAAGTRAQIGVLLAVPGLLAGVVENLRSGEWNVRKEAVWCVCNVATMGAPEQVRCVVAADVVAPLVDCLSTTDARMLCVVLDTIGALLATDAALGGALSAGRGPLADQFEEAGLLPALESGQEHPNEDVYAKCVAIITRHFGGGDEDEEEDGDESDGGAEENAPVPSGGSSGGSFGFGLAGTAAAVFGSSAANGGMAAAAAGGHAGSMMMASAFAGCAPPAESPAAGGASVAPLQLFASPPPPAFSFAGVQFV